jgi:cell division septation protein DedD
MLRKIYNSRFLSSLRKSSYTQPKQHSNVSKAFPFQHFLLLLAFPCNTLSQSNQVLTLSYNNLSSLPKTANHTTNPTIKMLLSSILVLSAATVGVFAAPVAQADAAAVTVAAEAAQVTAAHWKPTTTTTKKPKTTSTTTTTTTIKTTTTTTATASPTPALPLCKDGKLSL